MAHHMDVVRSVVVSENFSFYSFAMTALLSLSWTFAALPAMFPAFIAPPSAEQNGTIIEGFHTIIEELNLSQSDADFTITIYFLASLLIGWIPCFISDKIGRKTMVIISTLLTGLSSIVCSLTSNYPLFLLGRFMQGALFSTMVGIGLVFVCESLPFALHGRASIVFSIMWCVGYTTMAPLASLFPTWRMLLLAVGIPTILHALLIALLTRESLAYLISKKQYDKVDDWIQYSNRFARNKLPPLPPPSYEQLPLSETGTVKLSTPFKDIAIRLVIMVYMWITDFIVYNGLSLTSTTLQMGDPYWTYTLSGLVEVPSAVLLPSLMDIIGRRPSVMLTHVLTGVTLIVLPFIPQDHGHLYLFVWMIAKLGVAASFFALYIYAAELFPVECRTTCVGICCALGNIGALIVPFMYRLSPMLTMFIYGGISLGSCVLTTALPETRHA